MNVQVLRQTNVIPTLCVPTLKDPTSAAVFEATKEMVEPAPVRLMNSKEFHATFRVKLVISNMSLMFPTDLDECASPDTNSCHLNALCTNTGGSYVCRCLRGYNGDGQNCTGKCLV